MRTRTRIARLAVALVLMTAAVAAVAVPATAAARDGWHGSASTFRPIAQALSRRGYAVLRYNKRGVVGPGPVLSDDPALTDLDGYFTRLLADAEVALAFAADQPQVDPEQIYLLGHSEAR